MQSGQEHMYKVLFISLRLPFFIQLVFITFIQICLFDKARFCLQISEGKFVSCLNAYTLSVFTLKDLSHFHIVIYKHGT